MPLTERREAILRVIVNGYIAEAIPVASKAIVDRYGLEVSSATIRNDMKYLEQKGYITRPHSSAGSIPTDKAYRYYVESLNEGIELPSAEQGLIYQLFREAREEWEQWLKLAAALLARAVHNMAVVTSPMSSEHRLKHLEIVSLQDFLALLILVLYEAKVSQRVLPFNVRITQDELTRLANKLNAAYSGMTGKEILANKNKMELSVEENLVTETIIDTMFAEDKAAFGRPYLEGLRLMLSQPEFAKSPKILSILEILEGEDWLRNIICQERNECGVKIIIGKENPDVTLQELSLIVSQYGVPGKASGIVGVLGPRRMDYARAISSLNCFSTLLSNSVAEYV
jgi:heat shock gene repressor HrcA